MENIQTTPEILNPEALFELWAPVHPGVTRAMFFQWLSTPGIERDIFLKENAGVDYIVRNDITIPHIL